MKWATASLRQTLQRVRAADVNSGKRRRKVKVVSTEENGKSRTYKTYHILDTEYNKTEEKKADREIKDTDSVKTNLVSCFPFPCLTDQVLHSSLSESLTILHLSCVKQPGL